MGSRAAGLAAIVYASVAAFGALSLVLNRITPSGGERAVWAPIAAVMLATTAVVATSKPT